MNTDALKQTLALLANIRLGCKGVQGTNTLAYYEHFSITAVKSGQPFTLICNKLECLRVSSYSNLQSTVCDKHSILLLKDVNSAKGFMTAGMGD